MAARFVKKLNRCDLDSIEYDLDPDHLCARIQGDELRLHASDTVSCEQLESWIRSGALVIGRSPEYESPDPATVPAASPTKRAPAKTKAAPTTAAAPSKPDPDVDCRQAANKFIAKMKKCDLNMDGLDTSTFCPGKPGSATPEMMRSMADDSCEVILQRVSAAMDSK